LLLEGLKNPFGLTRRAGRDLSMFRWSGQITGSG
jgi:hypothetical protein